MVDQLQVTVLPECVHVPLPTGVVADTNVEAVGIVLVSTTLVACDVLPLMYCTRNCTSPVPSVIGSGETVMLEMPRSIWELTVTALLPLLFEVFGSLCVADTLEDNVNTPPRSEEHTSELQSRLHLVC